MTNYLLTIRTFDISGNPQRDYLTTVRAKSPQDAAEMVRMSYMDRQARVTVQEILPEVLGEFYVEKKTRITTRQIND